MIYSETFQVRCYEVDSHDNYKAFSFANVAQEIAHIHSTKMGFGYASIIDKNLVWIISRMHFKFVKTPRWEDIVTIKTWSKSTEGLFAIRDYMMTDQDGNPLILGTSSWLIMDLKERRLKRMDHALSKEDLDKNDPLSAIDENCSKIKPEKDLEFIWSREVRWSDLDHNLHANNAKYLEWTLDTLDANYLENKELSDIKISFNHETKLGDKVDLYRKSIDSNTFYVEGKNGEQSIFQVICTFR